MNALTEQAFFDKLSEIAKNTEKHSLSTYSIDEIYYKLISIEEILNYIAILLTLWFIYKIINKTIMYFKTKYKKRD